MKRYAVSPVDIPSKQIEKGKRYLITQWKEVSDEHPFGSFESMLGNDFGSCYCLTNTGCAFLDGERWTIIEEEEPSDG